MKSFRLSLAGAALALAAFGATSAEAALWDGSDGVDVAIPPLGVFGAGPQTIAPGIVWSSSNSRINGGSVFGALGGYGLGSNGVSPAGVSIIGLNDATSFSGGLPRMAIVFDNPVSAVGAFLNWVPDNGDLVFVSAFDAGNNILEQLLLNDTDGNVVTPGAFYGFKESSASIKAIQFSDGFVIAYGLKVISPVPEPATWALMIGGFGLAGAALRRRKVAVAA